MLPPLDPGPGMRPLMRSSLWYVFDSEMYI